MLVLTVMQNMLDYEGILVEITMQMMQVVLICIYLKYHKMRKRSNLKALF